MAAQRQELTAELYKEYDCFSQNYPTYAATSLLDTLRSSEYARLDQLGHIYLDYTGGSLYATSQLQQHMDLLSNGVYGNPHSTNPSSQAATRLTESARAAVLAYFNASPQEYTVIFTPNCSGALKLLGESYPFSPSGAYLLTFDNHNSVNGIREFAHTKGASVTYSPITTPELRLDDAALTAQLDAINPGSHSLFAFPAQSNFSGVQHDLGWIKYAHAHGWDVLLDAAAFVPTNRLDLSQYHPDFVVLSFYKIFGYPTGVGALIARRETLTKLRRPWFAGGTISLATVGEPSHFLHKGSEAFEDGTIDYLNLPGVEIGLKHIENVGIDLVHKRVVNLTSWLLDQMTALRHSNGIPIIQVYGPTTIDRRGGTISCSFHNPNGEIIKYAQVETLANARNISLRTGCFCNPGAGEVAFGVNAGSLRQALSNRQPRTMDELANILGQELGAVRISVGIASNFADAYRFIAFARTLVN